MKHLGFAMLLASCLSLSALAEAPMGHGGHPKAKATKKAEVKHVESKAEPQKHEEEKTRSCKT